MNPIFIIASAGFLFASPAPKDDPTNAAKKELEKFQGTWVVESAKADGNEIPDTKGKTITIAGDQMILFGQDDKKGNFTIDPSKNPRQINMQPREDDKNKQPAPGIYEFDGDTLK